MVQKRYRNELKLARNTIGKARRETYSKEILYKSPDIPMPLEYKDIDNTMTKFVEEELSMVVNGKEVPTFTLFSNQRFSEYSQTWQHVDDEDNLIFNFKTIHRATDPKKGTNQGELYNIPGERRYEISRRVVLDDNGTEHFEILSMKQPYTVDFSFKIGFVTDKFDEISKFNSKVHDLFKSRQVYIRPNGHYIPIVLESINDESKHSIEDRKFYSQTIDLKVMGYIISEGDYRVDMVPIRVVTAFEGSVNKKAPKVRLEETDIREEWSNLALTLNIDLDPFEFKTSFNIDTEMVVTETILENIRNLRIHVNDTPVFYEKGFKMFDNDEIRLRVRPLNENLPTKITFKGFVPKEFVKINDVPDNVYDEVPTEIEIDVVKEEEDIEKQSNIS